MSDEATALTGAGIMRDEVEQDRPQARGHLIRTGHKLTGYYVPTDHPGIVRLVRTCACANDTERKG
jgi:hypothetical protein